GVLRRLAPALNLVELVGSEPQLAGAAVDQRVGEALDVPGRLPDAWVENDRRGDSNDVVALLHHRPEPALPDVVLHQDAVMAGINGGAEAAVDLRGREDEAAPAAQRDDLVHRDDRCFLRFRHGATRYRRTGQNPPYDRSRLTRAGAAGDRLAAPPARKPGAVLRRGGDVAVRRGDSALLRRPRTLSADGDKR